MTGGRASRQKGNRLERALVHALQNAGFAAERVPLSGAARGRFGGDVSVPLLGVESAGRSQMSRQRIPPTLHVAERRRSAHRAG
jgi:hypothetical protein